MKIGALFYEMGPEAGGAFTFQRALFEAIQQAETAHEFVYWSTGEPAGADDPFRRIDQGRSIVPEPLRPLARSLRASRLGRRLVKDPGPFDRALAEDGVDLVWFMTNFAQEVDLPFIFTIWDIEYLRQPWFPEVSRGGEWAARDDYYSYWIPRATRVIVPNPAGTEQLVHHFRVDRQRLLEIHHPAPGLESRAAAAEADSGILDRLGVSTPYVFYPAQFWAHKNHVRILEALVELPQLRAVFVGSDKGGGLARVRNQASSLGVADRVVFAGFVELDELVALYRAAVALVYPSLFGPENLPPLEAFELGCPVIAADVPGAAEQLGDAAILVEPFDSRGFATAIQLLHDHADRRDELISRGRERVRGFSADNYVRRVLDFVDDFEKVRRLWK